MKIKKITISQIKGIDTQKLELNVNSNKPSILVAPNGFGKSSIAVAFEDMNGNRIALNKNNFREEKEGLDCNVKLEYERDGLSHILEATTTSNTIFDEFDVFVINSNLFAKTSQQNINGNTIAKSSIAVSSIELISTIPEANLFQNYSYKETKIKYKCGNVLPNLDHYINNYKLIESIGKSVNFSKFSQTIIERLLDNVGSLPNQYNGTIAYQKEEIKKDASFLQIMSHKHFIPLFNAIKINYPNLDECDIVYIGLQFIDLYNEDPTFFKKVCKYSSYLNEKNEYDSFFATIEKTWKDIKPIEKQGKLIVEFPKANLISNGQRDFLTFISSFIAIKRKLKKENCIIIIDEVFDYLDDSNLIVAQYFISSFIQQFKQEHKHLFPIILTHLDPDYFRNYRFKKQQIRYLKTINRKENKNIEKIILNRSTLADDVFKNEMDKYYFHFTPETERKTKDYADKFSINNYHACYDTPEKFRKKILDSLSNYINGQDYDIVSVCCALRVIIEEYVYHLLPSDTQKEKFIETHTTDKKLNYASSEGIDFPETVYLLGVIYNDSLHLGSIEKLTPLGYKLSNPFIFKMIKEVYELWNK